MVAVGTVQAAGEGLRKMGEEASRPGGDGLMLALEAACPRSASPKAVGWYLKKVKGRIVRGRRIVAVPGENAGNAYMLEVTR